MRGFTLLELLIVFAILGLLFGISFLALSRVQEVTALDVAKKDIVSVLADARARARVGYDDSVHGVRVESGRIIRFVSPYVSGASTNEERDMPAGVTLSASFGSEILFISGSGRANASGTIAITGIRGATTTPVIIYATGLIEE